MSLDSLETEPAIAESLFAEQIEPARTFTHQLAQHGEELGLIGPLELPRLWTRHILNSVLVAPLLVTGARVGDVGTGAGLPGLVLAIARPDVEFFLIEPMERRVDWLLSQQRLLGLDNVTVLRGRAEDMDGIDDLDQVTARAVSALSKLLPLTAPLLRDGGELVLMKGANAAKEIVAAEKVARKLKVTDLRVEVLGEGVVEETTRVVRGCVRSA
ncbi:16S rRNA (guanine(527)-N(7))-methyltransferase RsmG [Mycetocola reblochoni]|uniref:Ribosomal RNA small subunit methyltransferase G n=2 Tax=Mycetocola reblochoni TaxID=331618 RepID=A0A1R4JNM2_9MICO|nr:16S rRNA (guanine(527)-N(7))-methyltransferase RsmG [Mycetocola reblochoni]RLP68628.1 16S rRNA (guanine(527)-N(7))-methyltransferase RsmG [Mycetocola reblochoni]SJN33660.1 rRNA small subunit 7-methylguanosine (m7G) methyltransferase GidB [Mycetocola reblochoni REB411]